MFLGYHHPFGEVHIMDNNKWVSCPGKNYVNTRMNERGKNNLLAIILLIGQDNPSNECTVGDVPTVLEGNLNDHDGPYNGVTMGC